MFDVADNFAFELAVDFTGSGRHPSTKKAHDIGTGKRANAVLNEARVKGRKGFGVSKSDVSGIFTRRSAPIVLLVNGRTDLAVQGMDSIQNRAEHFGPVGLQLSIGQLLGFLPIINRNKTVFPPTITDPSSIQLLGQPLPTIETEINAKREPTLHPRMHEAENRMQKVVVEKQT